MKTCTGCSRELPATRDYFHVCRTGRFGLDSRCKQCRSKHQKARRTADPEGTRARKRAYYAQTRERQAQYALRYREKHLEEIRAKDREAKKRVGVCANCGAEFYGYGLKYCSNACRTLASRNRITFECKQCGKEVSRPASQAKFDNPTYCSSACWYAHARQQGLWGGIKPKVVKACETCGKPILVNPAGADRKRFCSQKCLVAWNGPHLSETRSQPGVWTDMTCLWCGEAFRIRKYRLKTGQGRFCSRQCLGAYTVKHKRQVVSLMEMRFVEVLRGAGLEFDTQARVGRFVIDVLFPQYRLAVEFDGDYWHSLPAIVAKDKRKNAVLQDEGYDVLHVREMDFVADADGTVIAVLEAIEAAQARSALQTEDPRV